MPNIAVLRDSKYLTRADCGPGILVTITNCAEANVAMESQPPEMQWILYFKECQKGMVLKSTNGQMIAKILNSENTDDWTGKQVVLYDDPNVVFAGKPVGGIRVRAPRIRPAANPVQVPNPQSPFIAHSSSPAGFGTPAQKPIPLASDLEPSEDVPF